MNRENTGDIILKKLDVPEKLSAIRSVSEIRQKKLEILNVRILKDIRQIHVKIGSADKFEKRAVSAFDIQVFVDDETDVAESSLIKYFHYVSP